MDLPERFMTEDGILKDGVPNFMKAGIVFADRVTTVSPSYAGEIMTEYFGEGLNWLLQSMAYKVSGMLNGIDVVAYDPATDKYIPENYSREDLKRQGCLQSRAAGGTRPDCRSGSAAGRHDFPPGRPEGCRAIIACPRRDA